MRFFAFWKNCEVEKQLFWPKLKFHSLNFDIFAITVSGQKIAPNTEVRGKVRKFGAFGAKKVRPEPELERTQPAGVRPEPRTHRKSSADSHVGSSTSEMIARCSSRVDSFIKSDNVVVVVDKELLSC